MSVLRYFIIIGILAVGVYVFSCTSPTEAPSPEFTEINSHTDSLLQFRIYLEQARISRFKGENQEEAHFLDAAEDIAQCLNDSSVYANLWQEKAMLYLSHQPEKAKEFFQKALAYMPSGTPVSIAQSELYLSRIYLEQGQTDSAFHYINNAICPNLPDKEAAALHLQKGYIFASLLQTDSATHHILPFLPDASLKQRTEAYRRLFEMYGKKQNEKQENLYMRKYILSHDSLSAERKEMVIEKIQDMHEYKLQRERANKAEMQAAHHKLVFYRIAVTLGVVILILLLLLHRIRVHKQKLTEELKTTQWMRMEETLKRKEAEGALAHEQEKLKQQEIDRLNKSVAYYRQLNAITLPFSVAEKEFARRTSLNGRGMGNHSAKRRHLLRRIYQTTEGMLPATYRRRTSFLLSGKDESSLVITVRNLPYCQRKHLAPEDETKGENAHRK